MRVSVVTPTYNRKDSLRVTLDGLARQSLPHDSFEAVVVSDGSTDGTAEMISDLASTLPYRVNFVTQQNQGPSAARNRGIREAANDLVVFLDDDVEPLPAMLETHARLHDADSRLAALGPMLPDPARATDEPAWIAWEHAKLKEIYDMFQPTGPYPDGAAAAFHFYSGNASVRRKWLLDLGGFDKSYSRQEDVELAVRLKRKHNIRFVYEHSAAGIHRPTRTFDSWVQIPIAYGKLDAQRLREGTLAWGDVQTLAQRRNPVTRAISSACVASPSIVPATSGALRGLALGLYSVGGKRGSLYALSALYNSVYAHALHQALRESHWTPPRDSARPVKGSADVARIG